MTAAVVAQDSGAVVVLADIAIVLLAGLVLGRCVRRLRQPIVIGEIVAGIALGPSVLGRLPGDPSAALFPADAHVLLSGVAQVGLVLFMFVMGWEFEKRLLRSHVNLVASVAVCSIALAFGLGVAIAPLLYAQHAVVAGHRVPFLAFAMFMGTAVSATAFPVLARILGDNGLTGTRIGTVALASAAIDDVLAWCLLAYVSALVSAGGNYLKLVRIAILAAGYLAALVVIVRPALKRLVRRWAGTESGASLIALLCVGAFLSAWATSWIGVHAFFGAFMFGLVMPRQPADVLTRHVRRPINMMSLVLLPVFFIVTGLGVDLGGLTGADYLALALVIGVACTGKALGAVVPAKMSGLPWSEAKDLGMLMNTRGLTELIILNAAVGLGILDDRMFTVFVIMALVTTAMAGPLLSRRQTRTDPPRTGAVPDLSEIRS